MVVPPGAKGAFECSVADFASVRELVGEYRLAEIICANFDVGTDGVQTAVIKYLAKAAGPSILENSHSINTQFLLFSGFLVFIMQAGFAMVSAVLARAKAGRSNRCNSL